MNPYLAKARNAVFGDPSKKVGTVDRRTGQHRATPWMERSDDCMYVGLDRSIWLYRVIENTPLQYSDVDEKLDHGRKFETILNDLGQSSIKAPPGMTNAPAGFYRDIHLLTVRWYERPVPPASSNRPLAAYQDQEVLAFVAPAQAMFVGVRLSNLDASKVSRANSIFELMKDLVGEAFDDSPTNFGFYRKDRDWVHQKLAAHGGRIPTDHERRQLESWFNHGNGAEPEIIPHPDHLLIDRDDKIEFAALERFQTTAFRAPGSEWIAAVMDHGDGPCVVSLRAQLQPGTDTRKQLRKSIRARREAEAEAAKTGEADRVEELQENELTVFAEQKYSGADAPASLRNCSVIFGHRETNYDREPYTDWLRHNFGIETKPLTHRQMAALEECMPCSQQRSNPFPLHISTEMAAHAGLGMFTELGEGGGAFVGRGLPEGTPVFFDPLEASRQNAPPATFIAGIPGSGKTLLALHMSYQAVLGGLKVSFVNPKGQDSLYPMVEWMRSQGLDCEWVSISRLFETEGPGTYDPFRYARQPATAAALVSNLITTVLDFDQTQRTALRHGLNQGAQAGARCAIEALQHVTDDFVREQVSAMWASTPLFALFMSDRPRPRFDAVAGAEGTGKFVLTEFDVDLNLPAGLRENYSDAERIGLAAVRAVTAANVGMLAGTSGGMFIVDEAHNILGHPDTVNQIQKLMREGRSLNLAQVYISQLVSDLLKVGGTGSSLESYISRVFALKMTDASEAAAALELVGFEPSEERIAQMREFGAVRLQSGVRPSFGYYRDLQGRKSIVSFGPLGQDFLAAASTNIDDRKARELAAIAERGEQVA